MARMKKSLHTVQQKVLLGLLREAREDANLRQEDVAQRLGRPQSFVSKYESGERRLDLLEFRNVCRVLGVSPVSFLQRLEKRLAELD
jgi:transcriptional regulator with XRE-family HTH domain